MAKQPNYTGGCLALGGCMGLLTLVCAIAVVAMCAGVMPAVSDSIKETSKEARDRSNRPKASAAMQATRLDFINRAMAAELIHKIETVDGTPHVHVQPALWAQFPIDSKRGLCAAVTFHAYQIPNLAKATTRDKILIIDSTTGRSIGFYSPPDGLFLY